MEATTVDVVVDAVEGAAGIEAVGMVAKTGGSTSGRPPTLVQNEVGKTIQQYLDSGGQKTEVRCGGQEKKRTGSTPGR